MRALIPHIHIQAIASALPADRKSLLEYIPRYGEPEVLKIMKTTGIHHVHVAKPEVTSSDLCMHAANQLFEESPEWKSQIDGLIFVSQTRDYLLPQTANILQHKLGLDVGTFCLDIPIGCSGYIHGLLQAAMLIHSASCKNVLVLAGDTTTRMLSPEDRTVTMVFGDAGTATLVSARTDAPPSGFLIYADGSGYRDLIVPAGGFRQPKTAETALLHPDSEGILRSAEHLFMDGMQVFNFSITRVPALVEEALQQMQWTREQTDAFIFHQANQFMVNYIAKKLKLPNAQVPLSVENYGNTGPSSIPLTLCDQFNQHAPEKVVMAGFGVGLSWGSAALSLKNCRIHKPFLI